jgi:hypothetical protein
VILLIILFSSFSFLKVVDPFERSDEPEHLPPVHTQHVQDERFLYLGNLKRTIQVA